MNIDATYQYVVLNEKKNVVFIMRGIMIVI